MSPPHTISMPLQKVFLRIVYSRPILSPQTSQQTFPFFVCWICVKDIDCNDYEHLQSSVWTDCVLIIPVLHFFLTMTSKLTLPLATAAWCRAWFLEVSVGSALLASGHDSLEDLISPWSFCCLFDFRTGWSWCSSAEDRISSGFSSSRRLGGLLKFFLLCTGSLCCNSGWICSGSGLLSSGGGSSTETRLATREEGSTAVTTRVTLRGKGAWRNTMIKY